MRLIDADELIKSFEEYKNDEGSKAIYGEEKLSLILGDCKIEVEKQPTAFDVDKVIGQLENAYINCFTTGDYKYNKAIDKAIDIVKSAQNYQLHGVEREDIEELKSCPKCGKQIDIEKNMYIPDST